MSRLLGRWGEERAAEYLRGRGYRILACNWRCRFGEIDIVAREGKTLCFVEVKLRRGDRYGRAAEQVDRRKRQRLTLAAQAYLEQHPEDCPMRFDVLEVYAPGGRTDRPPEILHWKDAFGTDGFFGGIP